MLVFQMARPASSAAPGAGRIVQAGAPPPARWHRKLTGNARWAEYSSFYINASTGNNENLGTTSGAALQSWDELMYRWRNQRVNRLVTGYGRTALGAVTGKIHLGPQGMVVLDMAQAASAQAVVTVSAVAGLVPASQEFNTLSCSGIASFTPYVGQRLRLVNGTNAAALSWIAVQNPHGAGDSV